MPSTAIKHKAQDADSIRAIEKIIPGVATSDGAGVKLRRYIGSRTLDYLDPFLLFDEFSSDDPKDYIAGFPPHPHRGMETVTYMIDGRVEHGDSMGNRGVIGKGDAQWMTAGSGIIHSEMPAMEKGLLRGLQLWVNLAAKNKMNQPRYRELKAAAIPVVNSNGASVRIIAGEYHGTKGAFADIAGDPLYLDVTLRAGVRFAVDVPKTHNAFAYVLEGAGNFGESPEAVSRKSLAVFRQDGNATLLARAHENELRFILAAGAPLNEPVARGGPFVMNTEAEIRTAWIEYQNGTFIKSKARIDERTG
ncbi:MAG: pirin family protein [Deltaproteobacteria bacterium]|nr:pirin family protein [Deltaproteobacteria bacterium]